MSKADARDWHDEQRKLSRLKEDAEDLESAFSHCRRRRSSVQFPSVYSLNELGMVDVAKLVSDAYSLLETAESLFLQRMGNENE